jgi:5S rRNA maturation endonuclease (ribonuclease M5)
VLTDFDREGVSLAKRLSRILTAQRVHANLSLWQALRHLTRSDVRSIEELVKYRQRLQVESLGRLPTWFPENKPRQSSTRARRHR